MIGLLFAAGDDVTGLHLDPDVDRWRLFRLDASEAQNNRTGAIADHFVIAVEQLAFDGAGARCGDGKMAQDLLPQMLGNMRLAQGAGQAFTGEPYLCGGVADLLAIARHHGVDRGDDLFFEMRFAAGALASAGGGLSRAASARFAGWPRGRDLFHIRHRRRLAVASNAPPCDVFQMAVSRL
jgi:hypothetical protein